MALTFNGSSSNYALKAITFSADKGTVMAWCRIATDRNDYSTFFQTNNIDDQQFVLQTAADGTTLGLYIYNGSVTGTNLTAGTWYHLALTWDGTTARAYVNGVLDISNSNTGSDWNEIRLGTSYWSEALNGNIAYVKAWDATLTQTEIAAEKDYGTAVRTANLVGQWLTPYGADRLVDSSGAGNHLGSFGTLTDITNPANPPYDVVTYVGSSTNGSTTAGTTATGNAVSGVIANDILLAAVIVEASNPTISNVPSGWNLLWKTTPGTRAITQAVYYKTATGSEPSTYAWTIPSSEWAVVIAAYRNAAVPTLYNSQGNDSTSATVTAPTLTPAVSLCYSIYFATNAYGTTYTPPANYTERIDYRTSTAAANISVEVADRQIVGTSAIGAIAGTAANGDYSIGGHVLLVPTVPGVSVTPAAAASPATAVAPTVVRGAITLTPAAASSAAVAAAPRVTIVPAAAAAAATAIAPQVTIVPAPAGAAATAIAPRVAIVPAAAASAATAIAPAVVRGAITLTPAVASSAAVAVAPKVTIVPAAAAAAATAIAPTVVAGTSVTVAPAAAIAAAAATAPLVAIVPPVASAAAVAIAPTVTTGAAVTVTPAAAAALAVAVAPTVQAGTAVTVAPAAAAAGAGAAAPDVLLGAITLTPAVAASGAAALAPTAVLGAITITPTAGMAAAGAVDPYIIAGLIVAIVTLNARRNLVLTAERSLTLTAERNLLLTAERDLSLTAIRDFELTFGRD